MTFMLVGPRAGYIAEKGSRADNVSRLEHVGSPADVPEAARNRHAADRGGDVRAGTLRLGSF